MCRFSEAELYCVNTNVRRMSEFMQFESAISTRRYLPPSGTAGFERCCVSGKSRLPAPPPRITAKSFVLAGIGTLNLIGLRPDVTGCFSGGFLRDLHADARAAAGRACFNHLARVVETFNTTGGFDSKSGADCATPQSNVGDSCAPFLTTGRSLDEIAA